MTVQDEMKVYDKICKYMKSHCYLMTIMKRSPLESVVNVNSIVKVNHTLKCEITLLLNDKQDEVPSQICRECQFYSQSENANAKYMTKQDRVRKYMI